MPTLIGLDGNLSINTGAYDNPAFTDAIAEIKPDVYRVNGSMSNGDGITPEGFHWKTDFPKLEQVKKMWDKCKPKLIFPLNMIDKGKRNNLLMLQHAAEIGLPVDDSFFELGNEFNIFGCAARKYVYTTTDAYGKACADWIKYIKPSFPNAQFLCVGEDKNYQDAQNWNSKVLSYCPDAFLVWHYHSPEQYCFNGVPNIDIIRAAIDEEKENAFSGIPTSKICMTEFSTEQMNHELREMVSFKDSAAEELAVSTMIKKFSETGLVMACYHNVIGAAGKGAIMTSRFGTWLEPAGKAIKAFIAAK